MRQTQLVFLLVAATCSFPISVQAQTRSALLPSTVPLEIELLEPDRSLLRNDVVTADTISKTQPTVPSLWWAKEQFDPFSGKLIGNWIAYPKENRVDVVVNRQLWTLLDYIDRYSFVNQFGTVARGYGYNIRVFNPQQALLAAYTCNFDTTQPDCSIWVESSEQDSLRVGSRARF
ncbi:MAG: hypothetical protein KME17_30070 [Cyanosarcina radialis HA8281-LM2]|jgi:hypothetical protein|nr:hypothetical protein [Cyanosarcina radialis HA8281-LM2]